MANGSSRWKAGFVVVLMLGVAGPVGEAGDQQPPEGGVHSDVRRDADRNRITDDLDDEMRDRPDGWTRQVIVQLNEAADAAVLARLKAAVGGFVIASNKAHPLDAEGRPWTLVPGFGTTLTKAQIAALAERSEVRHIAPAAPVRTQTHLVADTDKEAVGV